MSWGSVSFLRICSRLLGSSHRCAQAAHTGHLQSLAINVMGKMSLNEFPGSRRQHHIDASQQSFLKYSTWYSFLPFGFELEIPAAQALEDRLRTLEGFLREYQERRRLRSQRQPASASTDPARGSYLDVGAQGGLSQGRPAKRQRLVEAAKLEDQR